MSMLRSALEENERLKQRIRELEFSREVLDKGFVSMRDRALDLHLQLMSSKDRNRELESVLREALDANQFNSHGWVHRAITLLEPPR